MVLGVGGFLGHEALAAQIAEAAGVGLGQFLAADRFPHLRLGSGQRVAGPFQGGPGGGDAVVQIHRVHLRHQLAGGHDIADIHPHLLDPAGAGGADGVGAAGFHRADAEQGRLQVAPFRAGDGDANRRQGAGAGDDVAETAQEADDQDEQ